MSELKLTSWGEWVEPDAIPFQECVTYRWLGPDGETVLEIEGSGGTWLVSWAGCREEDELVLRSTDALLDFLAEHNLKIPKPAEG